MRRGRLVGFALILAAVVGGAGWVYRRLWISRGAQSLLSATDSHRIVELLAAGVPADSRDGEGATALHHAAERGDTESIECLLSARSPVDPTDESGYTPLLRAVRSGEPDAAELLLKRGADIHHSSTEGQNCLLLAIAGANGRSGAARQKPVAFVRRLLALGAPVDQADAAGSTPLLRAAELRLDEVAWLLLRHGARPEVRRRDGLTPLLGALQNDDWSLANELLDRGADARAKTLEGASALTLALRTDYLGFEPPLPPGAPRFAPGARATADFRLVPDHYDYARRVAMVKRLLRLGADPNAVTRSGETALSRAVRGAHPDLVRVLLAAGARPDPGHPARITALHHLAMSELWRTWPGTVRPFQTAPFPLHPTYAAGRRLSPQESAEPLRPIQEILTLLRSHGADLKQTTQQDRSPLIVAAEADATPLVGLFLESGARVDVGGDRGGRALFAAVLRQNPKVVSLLLSAGAAPDGPGERGRSVLEATRELMGRSRQGPYGFGKRQQAVLRLLEAAAQRGKPSRPDRTVKRL